MLSHVNDNLNKGQLVPQGTLWCTGPQLDCGEWWVFPVFKPTYGLSKQWQKDYCFSSLHLLLFIFSIFSLAKSLVFSGSVEKTLSLLSGLWFVEGYAKTGPSTAGFKVYFHQRHIICAITPFIDVIPFKLDFKLLYTLLEVTLYDRETSPGCY